MYRVEPIGAEFKGKGHVELAETLSQWEQDGWELVQVVPVTVRAGCMGLSKEQTNYAVLRRADTTSQPTGHTG